MATLVQEPAIVPDRVDAVFPHVSQSAASPFSGTGRGVSVLVLTKNEEMNIASCLRSLAFSDDVVVLDSGSTDRTVEIARAFPNVRVVTRPFDTEYLQRNHGLHGIQYKNKWVYVCDADERVPAELAAELSAIASDPANPHAAYRLRYRNMFMGQWLRRCSGAGVWLIRMVQPALARYEVRQTNVHPIVEGTIGEISGRFDHYSFNAGLIRWFRKHNYYSDREAIEAVRVRDSGLAKVGDVRSSDPIVRRRAMKNLSFFLPARGVWRFANDFFIRGGARDGKAGFLYCTLIAMYEYWIELKTKEQRANWKHKTDALVAKLLEGDFGPVPMMQDQSDDVSHDRIDRREQGMHAGMGRVAVA
ncbi:MAG: glycosyltransferase family 2 protein [Planctomycetota bacterium]|nr:glycosyltransferase family 2 protein [Planctomycetota bacterium]